MASKQHDTSNLLIYNAQYGVVICRECRYAIQKSALGSHILRHKIYRTDRQQLLASVAHVKILKPEDVRLPSRHDPPIQGLPLINGLKCMKEACGYLCSSSKRMQQHWSDEHKSDANGRSDSLFAEVKIQTFFRGTKIRYFEVSPFATSEVASAEPNADAASKETPIARKQNMNPIPPGQNQVNGSCSGFSKAAVLNLETLIYFHHFTTSTNFTLPTPRDGSPQDYSWSERLVPMALQRRWLMGGLLALSAYHLALTTTESPSIQQHSKLVEQYSAEFYNTWDDECTQHSLAERTAGSRVAWLLRASRFAAVPQIGYNSVSDPYPTCPSMIDLFVNHGVHLFESKSVDHAYGGTASKPSIRSSSSSFAITHHHQLDELSSRMTEVFGKPLPERIPQVLTTVSAITRLGECYEAILHPTSPEDLWRDMGIWCANIPDMFREMLARREPVALVVLAYWVPLLKRAEQSIYWFLKGASAEIVKEIKDTLNTEPENVKELIEWLE